MFVIKMDSSGNVLWAIAGGDQAGSCCDDRALGMHVTPGGDVFFTGTFWSSFYLGSCSVGWGQGNNHDTSVLAKLDKDGKPIYNEKGKVMKGPNYKEPNLKQFLK